MPELMVSPQAQLMYMCVCVCLCVSVCACMRTHTHAFSLYDPSLLAALHNYLLSNLGSPFCTCLFFSLYSFKAPCPGLTLLSAFNLRSLPPLCCLGIRRDIKHR